MNEIEERDARERQHVEVTESVEHQEWRARQDVNWSAVVKVGLGVGLLFFVLPGGTPWTGAAFGTTVMGRAFPLPWAAILLAHFVLSLSYVAVIASAIYRLRVPMALVIGVLVGAGLFAANCVMFAPWSAMNLETLPGHLLFGLFAAAAYKAVAVPPPHTRHHPAH